MTIFGIREDYALRALLELALHSGERPMQSHDLAQRQHIPAPYMDQILLQLRRGSIVRSVRGAGGGFLLARAPQDITVGDILRALRGEITVLAAPRGTASEEADTGAVREFWERLQNSICELVDKTTLQDLVQRQISLEQAQTPMFYI
jgi:Rrf2 family protein